MSITMKIDRAAALNGDFATDDAHPGWVQGWGVIKGPPHDREFAGIFIDPDAAQAAASKAGPGFVARWGSYDASIQDFVTGDTDNA